MKVIQASKIINEDWNYLQEKKYLNNPLVFVFANRFLLENHKVVDEIRKEFPYEDLIFASTSGEIFDCKVNENSISIIAIEFEKSSFVVCRENIFNLNKNRELIGETLIEKLPKDNLKHIFVLSDGSFVNGSSLIEGLEKQLDNKISITGGLCGDDFRFEKTLLSYKENPKEGEVVIIGLYGETLEVSFASVGGWMPFGPERRVTKSISNVLYEIDSKPALELYKKYLGDKYDNLSQASFFYPLSVTPENKTQSLVRTILNIDNEANTMTLAGDVPMNSKLQLMMASIDGIVDGAQTAAELAIKNRINEAQLALIVSCAGRKIVMNQRVEEEIEQVREVIGNKTAITGFYSYGEIAPFHGLNNSELHNQTITITLLSE
jgi:hypothetical protein